MSTQQTLAQNRSKPYPELMEFSVVYSDRSLNHMSFEFQDVMRNISQELKAVYSANAAIVVPGGGTYGMEAVVRQLAKQKRCLVIRNGWFSYRWSQIFEQSGLPADVKVLKAVPLSSQVSCSPFRPPAIESVVETIHKERPELVFAPHVETSAGILLPDEYIKAIGSACLEVGALFVLDCIASGTLWVDMKALGVDVLISAPQKGWSASPCAATVMLNGRGIAAVQQSNSDSFACDLKRWWEIMQAYENGGHAYHATMPTDALVRFNQQIEENKAFGYEKASSAQQELGKKVRQLLAEKGYQSVAAQGFGAPGVVVCYTNDDQIHNGKKFLEQGMQIAGGVPLMCDEPDDFKTFRLGLFGLDKLGHIDDTVSKLKQVLEAL